MKHNNNTTSTKLGFYHTAGTMGHDLPCYIKRQADVDLYSEISRGKYCYVLTSRQVGKSSLGASVKARLEAENEAAVAMIELTNLDQECTAEAWYRGLLEKIGEHLDLTTPLKEFWDDNKHLPTSQRFMKAIRQVVLFHCKKQVVIFLDEIENARSLPFSANSFFVGIRELFNNRAHDPELHRLVFCLIGSAKPSELISDVNITQFNIGQRIVISDFTLEEAAPLATGLGHKPRRAKKLLERVIYWTDGHPYLTQKLCEGIARKKIVNVRGVNRLCKEIFLSPGATGHDDNITSVRDRILNDNGLDKKQAEERRAKILTLYEKIYKKKNVPNEDTDELIDDLRLSGITKVEDGYVKVRNRIYEKVFNRKWLKKNMPDDEARRAHEAFMLGLWRTLAFVLPVTLIVFGLSIVANGLRIKANDEAALAEREKVKADQQREIAVATQRKAEESLRETEIARQEAEDAKLKTVEALKRAELSAKKAAAQTRIADEERRNAEDQREIAVEAQQKAVQEAVRAKEQERIAKEQKEIAEAQKATADENYRAFKQKQDEAEKEHAKADAQSLVTTAESQLMKDPTFSAILAARSVSKLLNDPGNANSNDAANIIRKGVEALAKALPSTTLLQSFDESKEPNNVVSFSFRGDDELVTISKEGSGKKWKISSTPAAPENLSPIILEKNKDGVVKDGSITAVTVSPDGQRMAVGTEKGKVRYINIVPAASPAVTRKIEAHRHPINGLVFNKCMDGNIQRDCKPEEYLLSASSSFWSSAVGRLSKDKRIWSKPSYFTWIRILTGTKDNHLANAMAFSPDGKLIAFARQDGETVIRDSENGQCIRKLSVYVSKPATNNQVKPAKAAVLGVAFNEAGDKLVTLNQDKTANVWNVLGLKPLRGKWYNPASRLKRLFKTKFDRCEHSEDSDPDFTIFGSEDAIGAAFSPDGKLLATAHHDGTVAIWSTEEKNELVTKPLITLAGHKGAVTGIAFRQKIDKPLYLGAISSDDKTTKIWNLKSAAHLKEMSGLIEELNHSESSDVQKRLNTLKSKYFPRPLTDAECQEFHLDCKADVRNIVKNILNSLILK